MPTYLGLEVATPAKPAKKKDTYVFLKTLASQVVTDTENDTRLPEFLDSIIGVDLLFENASLTSDFAGQDLSINLSAYSITAVIFKTFTSEDRYVVLFLVNDGKSYHLTCEVLDGSTYKNATRTVAVTAENTLNIGNCWVGGTTKNNSFMIPYKICGIR